MEEPSSSEEGPARRARVVRWIEEVRSSARPGDADLTRSAGRDGAESTGSSAGGSGFSSSPSGPGGPFRVSSASAMSRGRAAAAGVGRWRTVQPARIGADGAADANLAADDRVDRDE